MKNLQVITNDIWSCRREAFDCLAAAAFHALKSGDLSGLSALDDDNAVAAQKVNPISGFFGHDGLHGGDSAGESIKILSLRGFLFPWESERIIEEIDDAENDPSVIGVVLDIDGPGGCVSKVDLAATAIRNCSKPTATVVTGNMESAHFWLGVSADRTFVASPLCRVGCVGVVQHFMSFKKYYEEQGIIDTDIYPDSADMKNLEAREMYEKGNDEPLKKLLDASSG